MITADGVRTLVARQFPEWVDLPVTPVPSAGTEYMIYRLGPNLAVRLPRYTTGAQQLAVEHTWLPRLGAALPVAVPEIVALGTPDESQPLPWAVYRWLPGDHPDNGVDQRRLAADLGAFVADLRKIDATSAPNRVSRRIATHPRPVLPGMDGKGRRPGGHPGHDRGLAPGVGRPEWDGPPMWSHGDLLPGNILVRDGRLAAVIDFGTSGVGDPACDALAAWTLFDAEARAVFRAAAGFDDAMWARGQGWALTFASALSYYRDTNPTLASVAHRAINAVLAAN